MVPRCFKYFLFVFVFTSSVKDNFSIFILNYITPMHNVFINEKLTTKHNSRLQWTDWNGIGLTYIILCIFLNSTTLHHLIFKVIRWYPYISDIWIPPNYCKSLMIGWRKNSWNPERVPTIVTFVSVCPFAGYMVHLLT